MIATRRAQQSRWQRFLRISSLLLVVATASSSACALGSCAWLDLTENQGIQVVAQRKPTSGECDCLRCGAPGQFQLRRQGYTLEFWNGDRWYPELLVRARSGDGRRLAIESDQLRSIEGSVFVSAKWKEFDYSADVVNEIGSQTTFRFPERLHIRVLDADGRVVGTEEVVLRLETRRHLAFDSL